VDFSLNQRHKHKNRWNFALVRFNRKSSLLLFFFHLDKTSRITIFSPVIKKISQSRASCSLDFSMCFRQRALRSISFITGLGFSSLAHLIRIFTLLQKIQKIFSSFSHVNSHANCL
jgi:hypothetical protein